MARKKTERGQLTSMDIVQNKCKVCQVEYEARKATYENGEIVISPSRCPKCQTAHLTNLRVNKTLKDIKLLGNLKTRLEPKHREAIVDALANELKVLMDRYAGSTVAASAFDIANIK